MHWKNKHKLMPTKDVKKNKVKLVEDLLLYDKTPRMKLKDFLPILKEKWQY